MLSLFPEETLSAPAVEKGVEFSPCRQYRYALWRIWDKSKPLVMFIGLNPSTANGSTDDPTIESVTRIAKHNGYGGFYMMNCWAYISTKPEGLVPHEVAQNDSWLYRIRSTCRDVVFAWGNFKIVSKQGRDAELQKMFPGAKCICKNANGTPGHPLFKKGNSILVNW